MPIEEFAFKKVSFGSAQAAAYFQELINKGLKGLSFAFDICEIF